jgi:hypothetical protein
MTKQPLLITNLRSDTHCTICSMISIYEYFTGQMLSYKEGEEIQNFVSDKGLWIIPGLIWFVKQGFDIVHYTTFDYEAYYKQGDAYLKQFFNDQTIEEINNHSNLDSIKHLIPEYLNCISSKKINPTLEDLDRLLNDNYLVEVSVVYNKLYPKEADNNYHSVLVYGKVNQDSYLIMDPGLPARYSAASLQIMANCIQMELNKDGSCSSEMVGFKLK